MLTAWCNASFGLGVLPSFLDSGENGWAPVEFLFFVPQCALCNPAGLFFTLLIFPLPSIRKK